MESTHSKLLVPVELDAALVFVDSPDNRDGFVKLDLRHDDF